MTKYVLPHLLAEAQANSFEHKTGRLSEWARSRGAVLLATFENRIVFLEADGSTMEAWYSWGSDLHVETPSPSPSPVAVSQKDAGKFIAERLHEVVGMLQNGKADEATQLLIAFQESVQNGSNRWVIDGLLEEIRAWRSAITPWREKALQLDPDDLVEAARAQNLSLEHFTGFESRFSAAVEKDRSTIRANLSLMMSRLDEALEQVALRKKDAGSPRLSKEMDSMSISILRLSDLVDDALEYGGTAPVQSLGVFHDEAAESIQELAQGILAIGAP